MQKYFFSGNLKNKLTNKTTQEISNNTIELQKNRLLLNSFTMSITDYQNFNKFGLLNFYLILSIL